MGKGYHFWGHLEIPVSICNFEKEYILWIIFADVLH